MKIQKFNEALTKPDQINRQKFKTLFWELYDDFLNIANFTLINVSSGTPVYKLFCKVYTPINNTSYIKYKELFDILQNNDFEYSLDGHELNIMITDIQQFITEMETIVNAKKYNI